ncbi:MAG TPA: threonine--tRNA ligase [Candidatus Saccharimonadales bacterium]|nr:threonine--tRNA ligase [Candidatus Saccharimonadales bacterium]
MDDQPKLEENDHRRLGQELDLFVTSDLVGSGLPMLTPRGTVLREELTKYSNELREKRGFSKVWTPHLTKTDLYKTSGHWDKFGAELFLVKSQETSDQLVLKPMNCPHHIQIYASRPRSYRELPLKLLETATVYRDEKSGELQGLARVRSLSIDDCHVFSRQDQIEQVAKELIEAAQELYKTIGMNLKFRLSFKDEADGYLGSPELWDKAQTTLEKIAKEEKLDYHLEPGDAAFYGPKIDFLASDVLGRTWQVATVQLDFVMPERFELSYTDEQGQEARPVMIHCALLGSVERFLAVYIEHTSGKFPVWLAPEQVRIATLNDEDNILEFAKNVVEKAKEAGVRVTLDDSNESVAKKIREVEVMKVPYTIVIGAKEVESGQVTPRLRSDLGSEEKSYPVDEFIGKVSRDAKAHK